jgi:peroxiredoxin
MTPVGAGGRVMPVQGTFGTGVQTRPSLPTWRLAGRLALASLLPLSWIGCGGPDEAKGPRSVRDSGIEVAEGPSGRSPTGTGGAGNAVDPLIQPPPAAAPPSSSPPTSSPPASAPPSSAPPASAPPAGGFSPPPAGGAPLSPGGSPPVGGPELAGRSFNTIALPQGFDQPDQWLGFLPKVDSAWRDLLVAQASGLVQERDFRQRAVEISGIKQTAAEQLARLASTDEHRQTAGEARLEALSQLASLGAPGAMEQLRTFADQLQGDSNPRLSRQARLAGVSLLLNDLAQGESDQYDTATAQLISLLEGESGADRNVFELAVNAMSLMESLEQPAAEGRLRQAIVDRYLSDQDMDMSTVAWQLAAQGIPQFNQLFEALYGEQINPQAAESVGIVDPAALQTLSEQLISQLNVPQTLVLLGNEALQAEFMGRSQVTDALVRSVSPHLEQIENPDLKNQLQQIFGSITTQRGLVGAPLRLGELESLSGEPLDWDALAGKVVLVSFWDFSPGSLNEFTAMEQTYAAFRDRGFEIVAINMDADTQLAARRLEARPLEWPVYRSSDPQKAGFRMSAAQQLEVIALPLQLLIDRQGRVVKVHVRGDALMPAVAELLQ